MQLIKITSIPISIEIKTTRAQLKNISQQDGVGPKLSFSRNKGGLQLTSDPIRLNVDSTEMRKSVGYQTTQDLNKSYAQDGIRIAYEATAQYVDEGNYLSDTPASQNPIPDIAMNYFNRDIETMLAFIPSQAPNMSWDGGTLNIQYTADKLNFDWEVSHPQFEFIPPKIELNVLQMPKVIIEYLGGPIYVPPSANPNYEPTSFDAEA